ncbi:MAG: S-layer homology domain-containing protein [Oscillospiraceae bacterium]
MHSAFKKRFMAVVTAVTLCMSMLSGMVYADARYSDIKSDDVSEAVAVLSSLGIVNGYSDGTFRTDKTLTRAEFSKLAVLTEGKADEVTSNSYRTLFDDVTASYWALGYINLAYKDGLVSGYGDGNFGPDDSVNCAQAVTIVLRLLGYTTDDIGYFWPQDYIAKASDIGILDGISAGAYDPLTRGEAALMLYASLRLDTTSGDTFVSTIASSAIENVVILDNNAEADDGSAGNAKIYSSGSTEYYEQKIVIDESLVGMRGTILLNESGHVSGFVPDDSSTKVVSVESATASGFTTTTGAEYTMSGSTPVIYQGEATTYSNAYYNLAAQGSLRIYYNATGSINLLVTSYTATDEAVIAGTKNSILSILEDDFNLNSGRYTLYKNGVEAKDEDLEQYDVAIYDSSTSSLLVSNVKITGYIEDITPSIEAAETVTVCGNEFTVLESAQSQLANFSADSKVTLLLTTDGRVAGVYSPSTVTANMVGVLESTGSSAVVTLLNGITLTGAISSDTADDMVGHLVTAAYTSSGKLGVSSYSGDTTSSGLCVEAKTLGSLELAPDIKIFDQVGNDGYILEITLSDILVSTVPSSGINFYTTNTAGKVNLLVLDDVTGNCYTYGVVNVGTKTTTTGKQSTATANKAVSVTYGNDKETDYYIANTTTIKDGAIGGVAGSPDGEAAGIIKLSKADGITRSDFDGDDNITIDGVVYPISDDVVVYNDTLETWTTLSAVKAFTDSFTVYYDKTASTGGQIRVICAY